MRIGIVGGGLTGMALARRYGADGHDVTVVEYAEQIGGLATWSAFSGFSWDRFDHVIRSSDKNLIGLLEDLGMQDDLQWRTASNGLYVDEKLHPIGSKSEIPKSPLLSFSARVRFRSAMLYASRLNSWQPLESVTCEEWLRKVFGNENFEKFWKPLLLARLGQDYSRVSAVFVWSYIKSLSSAGAEQLGHVSGGYERIFKKIEKDVKASGGRVLLKETVMRVSRDASGVTIHTPMRKLTFDEVVCTSSINVVKTVVDDELLDVDNRRRVVEYLGVVCVVLVTKKPITHCYEVNIADEAIPFKSLVGLSNVVDVKNTKGYHLTYLSKYLLSTDPEIEKPDTYFKETFLDGVKRMFPGFSMQDLVSTHVHRAGKSQPLQVLNYSSIVPPVSTGDPRLHILNTSQFVNCPSSNNEVIGAVNKFYNSTYTAI